MKKHKLVTHRQYLLAATVLIISSMGFYAGTQLTHADYEPVERIHANQGDGYSFDIVYPPKASGKKNKPEPITVAVEGDSMSAITNESLYNTNAGSDMEVWWLRLDPKLRLKFLAFAQGKSGYKKQGETRPNSHPNDVNSGTNFQQRLAIPQITDAVRKADLMIIAGGFNDGLLNVSRADIQQAISTYMDTALQVRAQGGHDPSTVLVTDLWAQGTNNLGRGKVVPSIKQQAQRHGFTFVEEQGTFSGNQADTVDGIHYKGKAGDRIANRFEQRSNLHNLVKKLRAAP